MQLSRSREQARLRGKTALVTGASRGIGRAIAERLGRDGASVVVHYTQRSAEAQQVVAAIRAAGGQAIALAADIGTVDAIDELVRQTQQHFGALDILVNNAGIQLLKPITEVTEAEFDQMFQVNVKGPFFACQQAARSMADHGRIINVSTTVTRAMMAGYGLYGATKGAIEQLTRHLAKEVGARQITVNTVAPGPTDTEMLRGGQPEAQLAAQTQMLAQLTALGRVGQPEDIADVVAFLTSAEARWISGQTIYVNGGFA